MRRDRVTMAEIAAWPALLAAFEQAARGKRGRADVEAYRTNLDRELDRLRMGLLAGDYPLGRIRRFEIRDPKPRVIHAPCFSERVLHHALMAFVGPVLDRSLVADSFACRPGKGPLAAVRRAQEHARRGSWFVQIDIRHYFPGINHDRLLALIAGKIRDHEVLRLIGRVVHAHEDSSGHGLPIGTLTSQGFANFYLGDADRAALEGCHVGGYVRYMDDIVWWGRDRNAVRSVLDPMRGVIEEDLGLQIKAPVRVGRSRDGLSFCGFRILPDRLLLSRRRKKRYAAGRRQAEAAFDRGEISATELQQRFDVALAITAHADGTAWRREQLIRCPVASFLVEA
jgi:hypothetical protein